MKLSASVLFTVVALVLFVIAAVLAVGWVSSGVSAAGLAYFGLASLATAFLVN